MILTIRTDKPEAEVGLFDYSKQLAYDTWPAHRKLAETIHIKIAELLDSANKDWDEINGIVCYKGPGSFTGLRIGLSVGNTLAYSLGSPVVGTNHENWITQGVKLLVNGESDNIVNPKYGSPVHTTKQRK